MWLEIFITLRKIIYFITIIPYFDERYTQEAKNCDLDFSVEWFELLFRKIKLDMEAILIREGAIDVNKWRQY